MNEEAERMITGEPLPQLLQGPLRDGMIGDIDVQDSWFGVFLQSFMAQGPGDTDVPPD